jgi:hypothetical protein
MIQYLRESVSLSSSGLKDLCCTHENKQDEDCPQATPVKQGPWGRNERNKIPGRFDHMAASIKWIRVEYTVNPPGVGSLEVIYVEADGQERKERYCQNGLGPSKEEVNITAPTSTLAQYFIRFCCCVHFLYLCRHLMVVVCTISDNTRVL